MKNEEMILATVTDIDTFMQAMRENLDEDVSVFDLEQIKVPPAGQKNFVNSDGEPIKSLRGVIVHSQKNRTYWSVPLEESGGGEQPDCTSSDGITGQGDPGGPCAACPMAEWGSGKGGAGKACKEVRMIALLPANHSLPIILTAPPTSLTPLRKFFLKLAGQNTPLSTVEVEFELTQQTSRSGFSYSQLAPKVHRVLDPEEAQKVAGYIEAIRPVFQ
jgi:hypothetical protein